MSQPTPRDEFQFRIEQAIASVFNASSSSNYVSDWHEDDIALFRDHTKWGSFTDRSEVIYQQRLTRAARAVMKVLEEK